MWGRIVGLAFFKIFLPLDIPASWVNFEYQLEHVASYIREVTEAAPEIYGNGYHLVCHSQGTLLFCLS